jgi:isopentenyl phosphate kinase
MGELIFLKLGGSLITDKTAVEQVRLDVLARVAAEIAAARAGDPSLNLLLGHGSGSFGHVAAARHQTRRGVAGAAGWRGFAEVSDAAARLNRQVIAALLAAGVPAVAFQPSAAALCRDGQIISLPIVDGLRAALAAGLVPVIYGDVAFDETRGGTIIATEEVMTALAEPLRPRWLLLAGETAGVYDAAGQVVEAISAESLAGLLPALGGSRGTDVTGGMVAKVRQMLDLAATHAGLSVRIFSGLEPDLLHSLLLNPDQPAGTQIG